MNLLSRPRRPRRPHEWNAGRAVTFIVTLAATGIVTLAARTSGMSRKSAYALRARDPAFADAWDAAMKAHGKGDKVDEMDGPRLPPTRGNSAGRASRPRSPLGDLTIRARATAEQRNLFFARLAARSGTGAEPACG